MAQVGPLSPKIETLNHVLRPVEAFKAFDADNDGRITEAELGGMMGSLGIKASEQEVRAMMQQGDNNKDGLLSINEFLELNTKNLQAGNLANILSTAFQVFSEDGDEILTAEEIHEVLGNSGLDLSIEKCQNIVTTLDVDGDGDLSLDEFQLILNTLL